MVVESQYSYVKIVEFVVMPNHLHAIVRTGRDLSLHDSIKIKPLSQLVGAFKTTSSKKIHLLGCSDFAWQRSFYDHILRDDESLEDVFDYIQTNPSRWEKASKLQGISAELESRKMIGQKKEIN